MGAYWRDSLPALSLSDQPVQLEGTSLISCNSRNHVRYEHKYLSTNFRPRIGSGADVACAIMQRRHPGWYIWPDQNRKWLASYMPCCHVHVKLCNLLFVIVYCGCKSCGFASNCLTVMVQYVSIICLGWQCPSSRHFEGIITRLQNWKICLYVEQLVIPSLRQLA
jgi:hypothetical protein